VGRRIAVVQPRKDRVLEVGLEMCIAGPVAHVGNYNDAGIVASRIGILAFDRNVGDIAPGPRSFRRIEPGADTVPVGFVTG